MSTPVSTTVIALDVPVAPSPLSAGARTGFEQQVVGVLKQLGYVSLEAPGDHQTGLYLTLTLPPESKVDAALGRLAAAMADFEGHNVPLRIRAVAHHGTVFRTEAGGKVSYMGSAIRAAQNALSNAPATAGLTATRDFSDFAASSKLPFRFESQDKTVDAQGPISVLFAEQTAAAGKNDSGPAPLDPEVVQYLKKRLAEDVGPFAAPMVDMAMRSAATANLLVAKLTNEIDNPAARQRFEMDALAFITLHGKK